MIYVPTHRLLVNSPHFPFHWPIALKCFEPQIRRYILSVNRVVFVSQVEKEKLNISLWCWCCYRRKIGNGGVDLHTARKNSSYPQLGAHFQILVTGPLSPFVFKYDLTIFSPTGAFYSGLDGSRDVMSGFSSASEAYKPCYLLE